MRRIFWVPIVVLTVLLCVGPFARAHASGLNGVVLQDESGDGSGEDGFGYSESGQGVVSGDTVFDFGNSGSGGVGSQSVPDSSQTGGSGSDGSDPDKPEEISVVNPAPENPSDSANVGSGSLGAAEQHSSGSGAQSSGGGRRTGRDAALALLETVSDWLNEKMLPWVQTTLWPFLQAYGLYILLALIAFLILRAIVRARRRRFLKRRV